jgi:hypothetical protein
MVAAAQLENYRISPKIHSINLFTRKSYYIVEPQETHWTVGFGNGDSAGRFPSRREALESALRDAG